MEQRKPKWSEPAPADGIERLLADRYTQFLKWSSIFTRGDEGKAQELVQELCLYFTLTKPDLSGVLNLDGYLHTCLRHLYLSSLARSSREAQHIVSVAEFDSIEFALAANRSNDPLQRQNDLRRICSYTVWRKESSKTASYFICHFFHGYSRLEIAELARLPIAAIYNKLKAARTEVKSHLEGTGKLRILQRETPPEPVLSWSPVSSSDLFQELRMTILKARISDCLWEEDLLAHYRSLVPKPIPCSLMAHIVSCERCLAIVDRHLRRPTLQDREPFDGFGSSSGDGKASKEGSDKMARTGTLLAIRKRCAKIQQHRPRTLSIAVNGKIVALHEVQAAHNMLSARIDQPERADFVEVFSEQDVRLALLPIGDLPPEGSHIRSQRVALSDSRWLELKLIFDGLGLDSQVAYFDPALAGERTEDAEEHEGNAAAPQVNGPVSDLLNHTARDPWLDVFARFLRPLMPSSAMAWAFALTLVFGSAVYIIYRHVGLPVDGETILTRSVRLEASSLQGETEHQVVHLEETSADGRVLHQATVDLWNDGDDRRYLRRLYDARHHLLVSAWRDKHGEHRSSGKQADKNALDPLRLGTIASLWEQDLSSRAFRTLIDKAPQLQKSGDGYELTSSGPISGHPQFISATLVLDRNLAPVKEIVRVHSGAEIHELRFIRTDYERRPDSSIPDTLFDPKEELQGSRASHSSNSENKLSIATPTEVRLAQLQIAVLHQLNDLNADTGEPIEIVRTPNDHLLVSGAVSDSALRRSILNRLEALGDHQLLDLQLISPQDVTLHTHSTKNVISENASVFEVEGSKPEADATLRKHFQASGLVGDRLDAAVQQYSRNALQHAQRALQHAYALKRLSSALSVPEFASISDGSQRQWIEMVDRHAHDLQTELQTLQRQLEEIKASDQQPPDQRGNPLRIEYPAQFSEAAAQLLRQTQDLNGDMSRLFTSNPSGTKSSSHEDLLLTTINAIPLHQAEEVARFASRLHSKEPTYPVNHEDSEKTPGRPQ